MGIREQSIVKGRKRLVILAAVLMVGVGSTLAYAYFTSSGTGSGEATTGTSTAFTITSLAATGDALTPGGPAQVVGFTVTNPSTGAQILDSVVVTVANSDGSAWTAVPGCSAADYSVDPAVFTTGEIAPGGQVTGTVEVSMVNRDAPQDACKTVTVPLYFAAG